MRKTIIKNELELLEAIEFFGHEWEDEIKAEVQRKRSANLKRAGAK